MGSSDENAGRFGENVGRFSASRYRLDNVPFSDYGVVIDVSRSTLLSAPAAKLNMNREILTAARWFPVSGSRL